MSAIDTFSDLARSTSSPGEHMEVVVPSDTAQLARVSCALYVGTGGNVAVLTYSQQTVTFVSVPAGALLPIRVRRVNATGTSASSIVSIA
jgi:hypothetical protein